jgi:spore coat protein U-like protein
MSFRSKMFLSCALAMGVSAAQAALITSNFSVSTSVPTACTFTVPPSNMAFGTYSGSVDLDAQTALTINCTSGLSYKVYLTTGSGTRAMNTAVPGSTPLNYELYTDNARATVFPSSLASAVTQTGTGAGQILTIYGRIPKLQTVPAGSYSQIVTVNVDY